MVHGSQTGLQTILETHIFPKCKMFFKQCLFFWTVFADCVVDCFAFPPFRNLSRLCHVSGHFPYLTYHYCLVDISLRLDNAAVLHLKSVQFQFFTILHAGFFIFITSLLSWSASAAYSTVQSRTCADFSSVSDALHKRSFLLCTRKVLLHTSVSHQVLQLLVENVRTAFGHKVAALYPAKPVCLCSEYFSLLVIFPLCMLHCTVW